MHNLTGKTAVVCGSTQGIGKATAILFAERGASVTLIARNAEALQEVAALLPANGGRHNFIVADFMKHDQLLHALDAAAPRADILVNNTGGPHPGPALEASPQAFLDAFTAHLLANQLLVQYFAPAMKANNFGRIINIVSTSVREPIKGLGVSNTIRAAVAGWAKTLATELAPYGVTVNNVLPGATNTQRLAGIIAQKAQKTGRSLADIEAEMRDAIPAGRFAEPAEIAAAVAFLASPEAGYITGVSLPVDGGRLHCI